VNAQLRPSCILRVRGLRIGTVDFAGTPPVPSVFRWLVLLEKCAAWRSLMREIKRFSSVIQRFRLPISLHDQRRWRRDGWAVCPGGRFRPKLLKEMRRAAWQAKYLQSAEIRASPVKRSSVRNASGAQMCASRQLGSAMDSICKENVGIRAFF
jgi:hypothetical protein